MRLRIGLLYLALSVLNIVVVTAMIFENQLDLLRSNFRLQSDKVAADVIPRLELIDIQLDTDRAQLLRLLQENHIVAFTIFKSDGSCMFRMTEAQLAESSQTMASDLPPCSEAVGADLKRKTMQLSEESAFIKLRYILDLDESDYSARYLMIMRSTGIRSDSSSNVFLQSTVRVAEFQKRYRQLYVQAAIAAGLIFLAHALFALLVGRLFFRRVGILTDTSEAMASGNLNARVEWDMSRGDEIDLLGFTFNDMAGRIQSTVTTITNLNNDIKNELAIGKEVQEKFLPDPSMLTKWNAAIHYKPLRDVSGDLYSFFKLGESQGVFFADASGHGVSAALITGLALLSLERIVENSHSITDVVTELNHSLISHLKTAMFFMTSVLLIRKGNTIQYVGSGHPPGLLLRKNGGVDQIISTGPPLGIVTKMELEPLSIKVNPGDRLLLYSDGLVETESKEKEPFGEPRISASLMSTRSASTHESVDILMSSFYEFAHEVTDDVTVMYMEF